VANGFPQKRRLPGLRFHHHEVQGWNGNLQGDSRRPAAGPDVEQARVRTEVRPVAVSTMEVARGNQWLDQEPVNGFVWSVFQRERGEVDLLVPEFEEAVVGRQGLTGPGVQAEVRLPGPLCQPLAELAWGHG